MCVLKDSSPICLVLQGITSGQLTSSPSVVLSYWCCRHVFTETGSFPSLPLRWQQHDRQHTSTTRFTQRNTILGDTRVLFPSSSRLHKHRWDCAERVILGFVQLPNAQPCDHVLQCPDTAALRSRGYLHPGHWTVG